MKRRRSKQVVAGSGPTLTVPSQDSAIGTHSGTFKDGELLVNKDGFRIVSHNNAGEDPPIVIKPLDNNLSLADLESIKVIREESEGTVQLVRHKCTGQFFSLKVLHMSVLTAKQIAQKIKISLSTTQCPNVVVCYQCFYDNGVTSVVLEYMDGGSLADFLEIVKTIPEPYLAAICKQVLKGLIYLNHEKHIIHRDLIPSNILINHSGEVKMSCFGVTTISRNTCGKRSDTFIGTYAYMAPERISGQTHGYISDIWSLGLVVLECATGQIPYSHFTNFFELLEAVVDQPPPFAPQDQFSPEFCSFISDCLQKKEADRKSAQVLLSHPFLSMYDDLEIDLAFYFTFLGSPVHHLPSFEPF